MGAGAADQVGEGRGDGNRWRGLNLRLEDVAGAPEGAGVEESGGRPMEKGDQEVQWEGNPATERSSI